MANYPEVGKYSVEWLEQIISLDVNPFEEEGRRAFRVVLYNLRHLGLIREERLQFTDAVSSEEQSGG